MQNSDNVLHTHEPYIRPHQIDYMFHGFETQNFDPGGRPKKKKKNHEYH